MNVGNLIRNYYDDINIIKNSGQRPKRIIISSIQ